MSIITCVNILLDFQDHLMSLQEIISRKTLKKNLKTVTL